MPLIDDPTMVCVPELDSSIMLGLQNLAQQGSFSTPTLLPDPKMHFKQAHVACQLPSRVERNLCLDRPFLLVVMRFCLDP